MSQYSYIGKGSIYAGTAGKLVPIGNASALTLSAEENKKELQDFENASGGVLDTVSRISRVGLSMTLHNISPENLAMALRGSSTANATAAVTNEAHADVAIGSLVLLNRIPDPAVAMTVEKGATTLVENTDYTRVRAGIIPKAGGALADGDDITVSYSALPDNLVQAMISSGLEYHLVFDGLNEAKSGKSVIVDAFKVKFNPAQALNLIGDDFAELQIEGDVLKDETKSGAGISQYFTVRMAKL